MRRLQREGTTVGVPEVANNVREGGGVPVGVAMNQTLRGVEGILVTETIG